MTSRLSSATESEGAGENTTTLADQPRSVLDGLNLDTAIRLRWALRDIKVWRMKLSPVSQNDLMALIEPGLIEMQDDVPQLTYEGSSRDRLELKDIDGEKTEPQAGL